MAATCSDDGSGSGVNSELKGDAEKSVVISVFVVQFYGPVQLRRRFLQALLWLARSHDKPRIRSNVVHNMANQGLRRKRDDALPRTVYDPVPPPPSNTRTPPAVVYDIVAPKLTSARYRSKRTCPAHQFPKVASLQRR